jgi:hypothetical protein
MKRRVAALVLLVALLTGGEAPAQVPPPGPSVLSGQRDLRFRTVIAGMPTTIEWDSNRAARWLLFGKSGAEVQLDFLVLPSSLRSGSHELPITYGTVAAAWRVNGSSGAVHVFDPSVGTIARFPNGRNLMWIYLGGTVQPPPNQPPGDYAADVVLEATYTGN